ncbi:transporter substrate-binding domain-containing protein [Stutzerimonas urumqiensis]|uniref:substrate-binding periplasmic protein n=1 Tax=Stutzerimonas urumqiensis TaxID=638269 RepID=UPI003BAB5668
MLTRKRLLTLVTMSFLACFFSGPVRAEPLHVYVGEGQMPYADFHEKPRGLFGELMVALCDRLQLDCQFRSVPWLRVQQLVAQDARGVLLNLGRTEERERQFAWLLPVVRLPYVLHGLTRPLDSLEQALAAGPVAVMAGTPRARQLASVRQGDQMVVEVTDPALAARMLHSHRVLAWYEVAGRGDYLWKQLGFAASALRAGPPLGHFDSYIAASPRFEDADALSRRMNQAFEAMQRDGTWQELLERHLGPHHAALVVMPTPEARRSLPTKPVPDAEGEVREDIDPERRLEQIERQQSHHQ